MMATPTKRTLTDETHNAMIMSRTPRSNIVSDDLTARLQNIGSRVRKSVHDGYLTQRYASVPPTPHSSPVKQSASSTTPTAIFRSANETFIDVFSSPTRSATGTPSPSPRKRGRAEWEDDQAFNDNDDGTHMESEEEAIVFVLGPTTGRPIKPLRKPSHKLGALPAESIGGVADTSATVYVIAPSAMTTCDMEDEMKVDDSEWFNARY